MVLQAPAAMKLALGENPKLTYHERRETPTTRMATAAVIRENLAKAEEYREKLERALEDEEEEKDETLPISQNGLKSDFLEIYDELGINVTEDEAEHADWVMTSRDKEGSEFVLKARCVDMTLVPNVMGMWLRDALYLLENSGLKVGVSGVGTVSQQSLTPGGKVRRGSYVHIELR